MNILKVLRFSASKCPGGDVATPQHTGSTSAATIASHKSFAQNGQGTVRQSHRKVRIPRLTIQGVSGQVVSSRATVVGDRDLRHKSVSSRMKQLNYQVVRAEVESIEYTIPCNSTISWCSLYLSNCSALSHSLAPLPPHPQALELPLALQSEDPRSSAVRPSQHCSQTLAALQSDSRSSAVRRLQQRIATRIRPGTQTSHMK